ncbi:C2 domain-containing protein 5, partial [Gonioctena quinquepunctata]
NSLTGSDKSGGQTSGCFMRNNIVLPSKIHQENFDMLEYPFLTILKFPPDFISQIGGVVSARSVKRLETISNIEEPESRDTWWSELRMEIRSHARSLNCNAVLGYTESASICDDVCILSACGTAVIIDFHKNEEPEDRAASYKQNLVAKDIMTASLERNIIEKDKCIMNGNNKICESPENSMQISSSICTITHLTYESNNVPIKATVGKCMLCRKGRVPEVKTPEPEGFFNSPKDLKGEWIAKEISDGLPFLEYELQDSYKQAENKRDECDFWT